MTFARDSLGQFDIDAKRQGRSRRNQKLSTRGVAAQLDGRHHEENGPQNNVSVIREREQSQRHIERRFAGLRMKAKPDAGRKEEKAQTEEREVGPSRTLKRKDAEHEENRERQRPDHPEAAHSSATPASVRQSEDTAAYFFPAGAGAQEAHPHSTYGGSRGTSHPSCVTTDRLALASSRAPYRRESSRLCSEDAKSPTSSRMNDAPWQKLVD